jgi:hypothetical protein
VPAQRSSGGLSIFLYGVLYVALLAVVGGGSFYARSWAISVYGSPAAQAQWDAWRKDAARLATEGPVNRRVPKSDKPPALVLATTYFGVCLTIALVLTTVLFWTVAFFVQGVLTSPGCARDESPAKRIGQGK